MFKLIGALMLVGAGTACGFSASNRLKRRCEKLEKLIFAMKLLENETFYAKGDIKSTLRRIGEKNGPEFLCRAADNIESDGICAALSDAVRDYENDILGTDKEMLAPLWQNLGMTDSKAQIKVIRHTAGLLETAKTAADEEYEKNGRLRRSMGFLVGAFAAIMLF